jgi:hypothetical protein
VLYAVIQDWLELPSPPLFPWGPRQSERIVGWSTWWEPGKTEKYPPLNPPPPKLKRKKCKAHSVCAWAFPLAAWNFSSQKSLSPFWPELYPSQVQLFFIEFDWPRQKKIETMKAHKNWRFYAQMECLPLWPTDICEKGRTLSKTYGIKARCDWEHPWGTHCEPIGTKEKWKKSSSSPPPPPQILKEKNKTPWMQAEPSHWLHETSIPKTFWHRFQPWLIPPL